ncbi:MAG: TonB-dependent receptor [Cyclobacteriaceae bacterium]|nr:TonB-dependent receptor [Cyclobacteriaceae bacterium]
MKKSFIYITLLVTIRLALAQSVTVVDNTSLQPLPHAVIYSLQPPVSTTTNSRGQADISGFREADSIHFSFVSYQELVLSYDQVAAMKFRVAMIEKTYSLDEIVISASKFEEKRADVPQQIHVIKSKELQYMNQQTMADVMLQSGQVMVQKSQLGGGSPIIRGFETNKVLMVVDGVRMNNAIYRGGHLQNIITLDNAVMDKVEVVFGPGSVVYGSDALGGVMHFHTRSPVISDIEGQTLTNVNAFTRYSSAANEKTAHVDVNLGFRKVAFLSSITVSGFDDLRQGRNRNPFYGDWGKRAWYVGRINGVDSVIVNPDPAIQRGSGYQQYDFLQKIHFRPSGNVSHGLNFQFSTSSDIPRYDRLTQWSGASPKFAQWHYGPQNRLLAAYTLHLTEKKASYDVARLIVAWQQIEESRFDRRFQKNTLNHQIENLSIFSVNTDLAKKINQHELRYGMEGTFNAVASEAYTTDIRNGQKGPLSSRYPDGGSTYATAALYATHTYEVSPRVIVTDGVRLSQVALHSTFTDTTYFPFPIHEVRQNNRALSGNAGLIYMPGNEWRIAVLASTGFRAPNVDDLSKVFESVPGNVIIPNPGLRPEYTYNGELSLSKGFDERIRLEAVGYYTYYKNAITTNRWTFNGQDSIMYQGQLSQVTASVNARQALIAGTSWILQADVTSHFSITSSLNYTYGRLRTDSVNYPLDHIPPVFGKTSFVLKISQFRGEFFSLYNGWKRVKDYNLVGEDNFPNATPHGMPSWITLNARISGQLNRYLQMQMSLENILDSNYRVFASNIQASGRNFVIAIRGSF